MCGFCNLFGGRRNNGCCQQQEQYVSRRCEPRMSVHCASGLGEASAVPCGCEAECRTGNCCGRNHNHCCRRDCD